MMAALVPAVWSLAAKKKNPDDVTQTLTLPKDPPAMVEGDSRRLTFHVSPLSGKGLLSQQTRDALKAILKENGGVPVIHVRAFVAGSGDVRRIPQIVSELFTEKKLPLPSVSVILCGGLPLAGAQIVIESISLARKDIDPGGLSFTVSEEATGADPTSSVRPLLEKTLGALTAANPLRITCFVSNLENPGELTSAISARFHGAPIDLVQTQRSPFQAFAACEAVSRAPGAAPEKLAFTGTRVAFGTQEKDAALALQHLDRDLSDDAAILTHIYAVRNSAAATVRKLRSGSAPVMVIPVEGVASNDAGFAADAVALSRH